MPKKKKRKKKKSPLAKRKKMATLKFGTSPLLKTTQLNPFNDVRFRGVYCARRSVHEANEYS